MATQHPTFGIPFTDLAVSLLAEREVTPRARLLADAAASLVPGCGAVVYVIEDQSDPQWTARAVAGELEIHDRVVAFDAGTLGALVESAEPLLFQAAELPREHYSHLIIRRTFHSVACIPIRLDEMLLGAIEVVAYEQPLTAASLEPLGELAQCAAAALAGGIAYENERNESLRSISRLTSMYDFQVAFNSTLELEELMSIITSKACDLMNAQAVSLYMVESEERLLLVSRNGVDPTIAEGTALGPGEGIPAAVSEAGESMIIDDPEDPRLAERNGEVEEGRIFTLVAVPVLQGEQLVGVLEAVNRQDGAAFDDENEFMLSTIAGAAAGALHNASLLSAERKAEILETLVKVSTEITSTLNLERVLKAVVNGPQTVIAYERAAIGLEAEGRFALKAVSGVEVLNAGDPELARLRDLVEWAAALHEEIYVTQRGEVLDVEREETRAKFERYFEETGVRAFYAIPLADDQGSMGVLCFESSDPDFLQTVHFEIIKVLAGQATVSLRNAALYREVPLIGLLEPLLARKRRFMALEKSRRRLAIAVALAVLAFLVVFPLPMRVEGSAMVAPHRSAQVQPEVEGVVKQVYVREGESVAAGAVLADLEDWDYRAALAGAQAKYDEAVARMNHALAANDAAQAGVQKIQAEYWQSEVVRSRERLAHTHLLAPIAGVVATPQVENMVGRHLEPGDSLMELVDSSHATVDVAVDEQDVGLLKAGEGGAVKLEGFPTHIFRGTVRVVSPRGATQGEDRVFFARVEVPNSNGLVRPGMQGRGKISTGWRPAGYVFFRRPGMWIWGKLWNWFGF